MARVSEIERTRAHAMGTFNALHPARARADGWAPVAPLAACGPT
jgi:hypothetical protein